MPLRGSWGWWIFGEVWTLALLGNMQEIWLAKGARIGSLVIHILMGQLAMVRLRHALTPTGFAWLAAGGACHMLGIVFYALDHRVRHGLWHLLMPGGGICHFFTVLLYVALTAWTDMTAISFFKQLRPVGARPSAGTTHRPFAPCQAAARAAAGAAR